MTDTREAREELYRRCCRVMAQDEGTEARALAMADLVAALDPVALADLIVKARQADAHAAFFAHARLMLGL